MSLDARLWEHLEQHGLSEQHLALLLRVLEVQRNGHLAWHFVRGQLDHVDVRVVIPSRRGALSQLEAALDPPTSCHHS
jgi:hypothetical protein